MSNSEHNTAYSGRNRRRRKFIRRDLQLKIILATLFISLTILVFNFAVILIGLWAFKKNSTIDSVAVWAPVNYLIMLSFFISVLVSVPAAIWMGVSFSFKFCGPIYAIKKYFSELRDGLWTSRFRLRSTDDLQDVKDVINESLDLFRSRLMLQNELLEEAGGLFESLVLPPSDRERIAAIVERLRAESEEVQRRFPVPERVAAEIEKSLESSPSIDPVPIEDGTSEAEALETSSAG